MPRNYAVPKIGAITDATQYDGVILAAASRGTGDTNSAEYTNPGARGIRLFINVTNVGSSGTVTVKIQNFDPASQTWMDVPGATTSALGSVAGTVFTVYPGDSQTGSIATSLGLRWRVVASVATDTVAFSVGGDYLDG